MCFGKGPKGGENELMVSGKRKLLKIESADYSMLI